MVFLFILIAIILLIIFSKINIEVINFKFTSEVDAGYSHICFNEITSVSMVDDIDSIMENLQAKREENSDSTNI